MALVSCSQCGGQVSTEASTCPHCGAPRKRAGTSPWTIIGWLFLGFLLLLMYGCYQVFKPGGPMDPNPATAPARSAATEPAPLPAPPYELEVLSFVCEETGGDLRAEVSVRNIGPAPIQGPELYFTIGGQVVDGTASPYEIPVEAMGTVFARGPTGGACTLDHAQDWKGNPIKLTSKAK